tara:strand:+ start:118 stop:552 length:435 start_codon:yes stop_codon:yes gene_type:complete
MSNNIREDCGSSKLNYSKKNWDIVCQRYFEKSDFNIKEFYGDVLYVGMGSAYGPRNQSKNVKTTTILEKYPEIIKKYNDTSQNWNIIQGCAYDYEFKDQKFDIIMLDVWAQYICKEEYSILYPKFKKYLKDNGKILIIKTLKTK